MPRPQRPGQDEQTWDGAFSQINPFELSEMDNSVAMQEHQITLVTVDPAASQQEICPPLLALRTS
jgi:hypothetical protein